MVDGRAQEVFLVDYVYVLSLFFIDFYQFSIFFESFFIVSVWNLCFFQGKLECVDLSGIALQVQLELDDDVD